MTYCHHCGHNLTADKPITKGLWELGPDTAHHDGQRLNLTAQEAALLHTLATANGFNIRAEVIGSRIGQAEDPNNLCAVVIHRLRAKLGDLCPVKNDPGQGYRWAANQGGL